MRKATGSGRLNSRNGGQKRKKAQQPPKEKKPPMTKQERSRKVMEWQREYYRMNPDKLEERREKNRIAQRKKYVAKKAAKMTAMG